ncbi:HAD-IA family hydrolase [Pontibaca methylaminivorans]|uniref:HAD-IA family hydrolase n=1 Tax=Pontibaca methylaminivorans TaxID=515897 RepID=UPI002FDAD01F
MHTVIFDLDGTLADTSGDLLAAANACFREMGLGDVLDHSRDAGIALRGGRPMLAEGLRRHRRYDADLVERYYPRLLECYRDAIDVHTVLYPGVETAIGALKSAGHPVGICTNKPEALAELLLGRLGIRGVFDSLVGADTLAVRKPDPEPLREAVRRAGGDPALCLLVGDSDTDHATARAAGVPSVLVTFGPAGNSVAALKPEALLGSFAELPGLVTRLTGESGRRPPAMSRMP